MHSSPQPPARLLMIGIDAASAALVDRWIADGSLPTLARLAARGLRAPLRGIEGFYVGSTWPSMYTGTNPARHGVHYLTQLEPGTYRLYPVAQSDFVRRPAFWDVLSRAGKRVAILDVPLTRLDPSLQGVQVIEWGGHDALYGFHTWPDDLAGQIVDRHGTHPLTGGCDRRGRTNEEFAEFVGVLEEGIRRKAEWTRELLRRGGWDLFMQVFTESHCVGHQCWHLHDPAHPAHDPGYVRQHGDPLRRVYQAIDAAIGRILEDAGDATVLVFAAHDMAHRFGAQFLLRDLLVRLGVTVPAATQSPARATGLRAAAEWGWTHLPELLRRPIRRLRRTAERSRAEPRLPTLRIDERRSRCFPLNNGLAVGGIRLNLQGREPSGVLAPGPAADDFAAQLSAQLLEIIDVRTGRPLIARVRRTADLFGGEHLDALPDLLVEWADTEPLGSTALGPPALARVRAALPGRGEIEGANDYARTGEHRPPGWLIAAGPGMSSGRLAPVSLLDLAPTACAMLGVAMPETDGVPVPALAGMPA